MSTHFSWQSGIVSSGLEPTTKLVLFVIGSYMNQHGTGAFPSYNTIAEGASVGRTTAIRHVEKAVTAGWLTKKARRKGATESETNMYAISFPVSSDREPAASGGVVSQEHQGGVAMTPGWCHGDTGVVSQEHQGGVTATPGWCHGDTQTLQLTPQLTPHLTQAGEKSDRSTEHPLFAQAWDAYPKRDGGNPRGAALKAWNARIAAGDSAEAMLAGVLRYAAFCQAQGNVGTRYVKQAATFFGPDRHFAEPWAVAGQGRDVEGGGDWWLKAGFGKRWEAEVAGATPGNAHLWRERRPVRAIQGVDVEPWPAGELA